MMTKDGGRCTIATTAPADFLTYVSMLLCQIPHYIQRIYICSNIIWVGDSVDGWLVNLSWKKTKRTKWEEGDITRRLEAGMTC